MNGSIFDGLTHTANRRGFLSTAAKAAGAIALAMIGVKPAFAALYSVNGCDLCANPSTCTYSGCACQWCWLGDLVPTGGGDCYQYLCYECYSAAVCPGAGSCPTQSAGSNGCPNPGWICSKSVYYQTVTNCGGGSGCFGACCHKDC
jgi:hypothetical protein